MFSHLSFFEFFRVAVSMFGLIGIFLRIFCTVVNPSGLSESFVSEECGLFVPLLFIMFRCFAFHSRVFRTGSLLGISG